MKRLGALLTGLILAAGLSACGGGGGNETCSGFGSACPAGGTLQACCTSTQCRYVASDGSNFPCNGTDCTSAAQKATMWCTTH